VVPHPDWIIPDWPAPAHVRALCTTRAGGVSVAPFDGLNLGDHVGDDPAAVAGNRALLQSALGVRPVFLSQVHGVDVVMLQPDTADGTCADAAVADRPGLACTVMVADCLPVLMSGRQGRAVAAAHAGWRGLAGAGGGTGEGVLEAVFKQFCAIPSVKASLDAPEKVAAELLVWLGPCIGPERFEVGAEVRDAFVRGHAAAEAAFQPGGGGRFLASLPALARLRLQALGIGSIGGNDGSAAWCTVGESERFFSHRRDSARLGGSGRFAACIWLSGRGGG